MLDVTKEKQPEVASDGEMSGEEWGEDWELVEMPQTPGENFPLDVGEYGGGMPYPIQERLVFSNPVGMVVENSLKMQVTMEGWSYCRPDGTGFLEAKHLAHGDGKAVVYSIGEGLPFATVISSPDASSFLVRDGNYDPYCTVERANTMFGWQMKIRPWQGNQTRKKNGRGKPVYLVHKKSKSLTVEKKERNKRVEVACMLYGIPAREHLAQGVAHSFVVQPGEDVGLMVIAMTAAARSWQKGEPTCEIGCWKDGTYTRGPSRGGGGTSGAGIAVALMSC